MTLHALQRTVKRANISINAAKRMVNRAEVYGKVPADFPAKERRYLLKIENNGSVQVRIYAEFCFIFSADFNCITMYHVPGWFGRTCNFDGKNAIRNPKKYMKFCS